MVLTRLQSAFASPPFRARTAPDVVGPFASRYGSDLLPLRLPSHCSWVGRFFDPPQSGGFAKFAIFARSPNSFAVFELPFAGGAFVARLSRPTLEPVLAHSSNLDPLGHCVSSRIETLREPDSARTRFLIAPRRSVPCSHFLAGATPPRGTGETCLADLAIGRGSTDQLRRPFPGCPGLSQGCLRRFFHYSGHIPAQFQTPTAPRRVRRFFRVWSLFRLPCRTDHPAYFGLTKF